MKTFTSCLKNSCFVSWRVFRVFHFFSFLFLTVFLSFCFHFFSLSFLLVFTFYYYYYYYYFFFSFLQMFLYCLRCYHKCNRIGRKIFTLRRFLAYTLSHFYQGFPGACSSVLKVAGPPTEV